jgi:biopolymer transport protein ExbD/biopolymer transport protein TolR
VAIAINGGGNGGRRRFRGSTSLSEINVTPFVDVVLVLLIIFMLTAHVMEFGLEIDVPKVKQVRDSAQELPVVAISRSGELYLNEKPVNINALGSEFRKRFPGAKQVYLRADRQTIYDPIAQVVSTLGEAGLDVKLVTRPDDSGGTK